MRFRIVLLLAAFCGSVLLGRSARAGDPSFREYVDSLGLKLEIEELAPHKVGDPWRFMAHVKHPTKGIMLKYTPSAGTFESPSGYAATKSGALKALIGKMSGMVMQITPWEGKQGTRETHYVPSHFSRANKLRAKVRAK
jgi:hypothetical protein